MGYSRPGSPGNCPCPREFTVAGRRSEEVSGRGQPRLHGPWFWNTGRRKAAGVGVHTRACGRGGWGGWGGRGEAGLWRSWAQAPPVWDLRALPPCICFPLSCMWGGEGIYRSQIHSLSRGGTCRDAQACRPFLSPDKTAPRCLGQWPSSGAPGTENLRLQEKDRRGGCVAGAPMGMLVPEDPGPARLPENRASG